MRWDSILTQASPLSQQYRGRFVLVLVELIDHGHAILNPPLMFTVEHLEQKNQPR